MRDWVECQSCQVEFKVVSVRDESIDYCPFCGGVIEQEEDQNDLIGYDEDEEYYE